MPYHSRQGRSARPGGEMVGFGIIVQLCMEKNEEELEKVIPFFTELGLPLTMKELGLPSVEDSDFQAGLRKTCATGSAVHNMPFPVNETLLEKAMIEADQRAASFRT